MGFGLHERRAKHYACAVIWRYSPDMRCIEFLVLDVVSHDNRGQKTGKQTKFPGGCERMENDPIDVTLRREIVEETYLAFLPQDAKKIWEKPIHGRDHVKYGFLLFYGKCRGELRKEPLTDTGDQMSPPYWVEYKELRYKLYDTHQEPYMLAIQELEIQGII